MIVMGFFIVNVAFPSIQADLHASGSAIEWVVAPDTDSPTPAS